MSTNQNNQKGVIIIALLLMVGFYLILEKVTEKKILQEQAAEQLRPITEEIDCTNLDFDKLADCIEKQRARTYEKVGMDTPKSNFEVKFIDYVTKKEMETEVNGKFIKFKRNESLDLTRCAYNSPLLNIESLAINMLPVEGKMFVVCIDESNQQLAAYHSNDWEEAEAKKTIEEWMDSLKKAKAQYEKNIKALGNDPKSYPPMPDMEKMKPTDKMYIDPNAVKEAIEYEKKLNETALPGAVDGEAPKGESY